MNDLPGYRVDEVYGEVFGLTVRARNVGSQMGASLKSLVAFNRSPLASIISCNLGSWTGATPLRKDSTF